MTQLELWDDSRMGIPRGKVELKVFVNGDDKTIYEHRLARCVYAETLAESLPAVEALCVMIRNTGRDIAQIVRDENVFESLRSESVRHADLLVDPKSPGFQMCLRAVHNMAALRDTVSGAVRFHRSDAMPEWAASIGSIAEVGGLSFYA